MATRDAKANNSNGWIKRLAIVVGLGLIIFWFAGVRAVAPDPNAIKVQGPDTLGNPIFVQVNGSSSTGSTQTALSSSSANAAAGNNNSLGAVANQTTYVTGFQITGGGATAGSNIAVTLSNVAGVTQNYVIVIPAGATTSITPLIVTFNPPLPASAVNTVITLSVPSFGAGNTNAAVSIQGFRQ